MGQTLKVVHRMRIDAMIANGRFAQLDQFLAKLSAKGFDVAGVPFRLIDDLVSDASAADVAAALPLARHTLGGQPRLFKAIVRDLDHPPGQHLRGIVEDADAHPMTRFEAMGWAAFVRHRTRFPTTGTPVEGVFQFWDHPDPPPEILDGKQQWQRCADVHQWYDDHAAQAYIAEGFGQRAADDYAKLWHPALKSDVFRLYRLVRDGGCYCDADSRPEYRAADVLRVTGGKVWATSMTNVPNCVANNWFIAAPPQSPLVEGLLDVVLRNIQDVASRGIFWLSGPGAFTAFIYGAGERLDLGLLPRGLVHDGLFRQFDADYKYTDRNWRVFEHKQDLGNDAGLARVLSDLDDRASGRFQ